MFIKEDSFFLFVYNKVKGCFLNNVVHFNMILEINQLLKENNIEYSIHGVGGCTCCGLELRQDGKSYPQIRF